MRIRQREADLSPNISIAQKQKPLPLLWGVDFASTLQVEYCLSRLFCKSCFNPVLFLHVPTWPIHSLDTWSDLSVNAAVFSAPYGQQIIIGSLVVAETCYRLPHLLPGFSWNVWPICWLKIEVIMRMGLVSIFYGWSATGILQTSLNSPCAPKILRQTFFFFDFRTSAGKKRTPWTLSMLPKTNLKPS